MLVVRKYYSPLILAAAFSLFGCKSATGPSNTPTTSGTPDPGEFGYMSNGTSLDRKDFPGTLSAGAATYTPNPTMPGTTDITLTLNSSTSPHKRIVELRIPMIKPDTGTFDVVTDGTMMSLMLDSTPYASQTSGSITISKFDTTKKVISGTFRFEGVYSGDSAHVMKGYFNEIPLTIAAYDYGLVTAMVNGVLFTSKYSTSPPNIYSVDGGQHLVMLISGDSGSTVIKSLGFGITNPGEGYYDLNVNTGGLWFGTYVQNTPDVASISTTTGAYGRITFTSFDWSTFRMSGTFYLHGQDANTNEQIDVVGGKIENVPWVLK